MHYLILILLALVLILLFLQALVKADVTRLVRHLRFGGAGLAFLLALLFGFTGRLAYAVPLVIAGFAILGKHSPLRGGLNWGGAKSARQNSRVRTSLIEMTLDHDTGHMTGKVLAGDYEGRELGELGLEDLASLYTTARTTRDQSLDLLESYLDRHHPDWAQHEVFSDHAGKTRPRTKSSGPMTPDEASEVLGLKPGASQSDINSAHKALMKKLHPDQGGSSYLAAKINEAKEVLGR